MQILNPLLICYAKQMMLFLISLGQEFPDAISKKLYNIAMEILTTERA